MLRSAASGGLAESRRAAPRLHDTWLDQLGSIDFDRLSQDGKVDYLLLKNHLDHELRQVDIRWHERAEWSRWSPSLRSSSTSTRPGAIKPMEWSKVAGELIRLNKEIGEVRRTLERSGRAGIGNKPRGTPWRRTGLPTGRCRPSKDWEHAPHLVRVLRRL